MNIEKIFIQTRGKKVAIEAFDRPGEKPAILFLHGFGSTRKDYEPAAEFPGFSGRRILAFDCPGHGASRPTNPEKVTIDFLCRVTARAIEHFNLEKFHLAGHSMGGLTALKILPGLGDRVLSFINIEGNLAPEDCFLSRQILEFPSLTPKQFLNRLAKTQTAANLPGHAAYAKNLKKNVMPEVVEAIFRSMVEITDNENLLMQFIKAPVSKLFVYGEENRGLSYLPALRKNGVALGEIPGAAHFPMYSNPGALWQTVSRFIDAVEEGPNG